MYFGNRDFNAKEVGYIINKNYQRKGYASEAINALVEEAFANSVHRLFAECNPKNICSWKLLEQLGFVREAHFRKNIYFKKDENNNPVWQDTYVYSLLEEIKQT